jgi:hypothetical protein
LRVLVVAYDHIVPVLLTSGVDICTIEILGQTTLFLGSGDLVLRALLLGC